MIQKKLGIAMLVSACLWLGMDCSSNNLAGGTGIGNPGSVTTVSIIAHSDTGAVANRLSPDYPPYSSLHTLNSLYPKIPIFDDDSLRFNVKLATMKVNILKFMFADSVDIKKILSNFQGQVSSDSESVFVQGPFVFDAINGTCTPALDKLRLPEAQYKALKILMGKHEQISSDTFDISLAGDFIYKGVTRNFSIQVLVDLNKMYKNVSGDIQLVSKDSTFITLILNASVWLNNLRLRQMLDNNVIALNSAGNLVIDETLADKPYKDIVKTIRKNIPESGTLIITSH